MIRTTANRIAAPLMIAILLVSASGARAAFKFESQYKTVLTADDHVLGSLKSNYLVYDHPQITLYDSDGKKLFIKKIDYSSRPVISPNGKHVVVVTYDSKSPTDLRTLRVDFYDLAGKKQWTFNKPTPNTFMLADNGAIFGIEGVEGLSPTRIHMFDQFGSLLNMLTFKAYRGLAISPSGLKLAVDNGKEGLFVYDSVGNQLAVLPSAKQYVFDNDDRYLGTFADGVFRLYQDQKVVQTIKTPEPVMVQIAINVQKNLVALMATKRVALYELVSGNMIWEFRVQEPDRMFTTVDLADNGKIIVCGMDVNNGSTIPKEKRHSKGYIYVFAADGKTLTPWPESYALWGIGFPKAAVNANGSSMMVLTREKIEKVLIK